MKFEAKVLIYKRKRPFPEIGYRPHIAKINSVNLLGVKFTYFDENRSNDRYVDCIVQTSYPDVDYNELIEGQTYDVREGPS